MNKNNSYPQLIATKLDSVLSFTVTLKGRIPMTFPWWVDITTVTLGDLRDQIYEKDDSLNNGQRTVMVYESDVSTTCYSYLETDDKLQRWLRRRADKSLLDISVRLEGPSRPFPDIPTAYANRIYHSDPRLPIGKVPSTTTECTRALDDLFASLKAAIKAAPPENGSGYSLYVNAFLVHAVGLFPELMLLFDAPVSGRRGYGLTPCTVQSRTNPSYILPVTVTGGRQHISNIEDGIARNKVQLDVVSSNRKRKSEYDTDNMDVTDDAEDTGDTDSADDTGNTAPTKSYWIVTNAETWVFLQCAIDNLHDTGYNDPVSHRSNPSAIVNYFSQEDKWKADVRMIFEHLVWQLQRMVDDISPKNKRFKSL
jgi:hypothetical protein